VGGQVTAVTRRRHRRWRAVGAFLKTIPGVLTAIATLLTAIAGLLAALAQVGVITIRSPIVANPPAEERPVPDPATGGGAGGGGTGPGSGGGQGPALVYLDQLTPLQQPGSWYQEGARAVNGRDFARSVAIRQPSRGQTATTVFNLGRHYAALRFTIGLGDDSDPALQSKCQVFADQQVIFDSGIMTRGRSAEVVRDVSDSFDLVISCTPIQDGSADGEVVLADAQLTPKPGQAPTTTSP
jgi:NPCBM/NEW2 domain